MKLEHRNNCVLVKYIPNRNEPDGYFDYETNKIYLDKSLTLAERECVYFHEITHKKCRDKDCYCQDKDALCEYHAMLGALNMVIARNSKSIRKGYFKSFYKCLARYKSDPKTWKAHLSACHRIMKLKAYKKLARENRNDT